MSRPERIVPGHNVDRIDVAAGLRELATCGYDDPKTVMVITYALQRWARGEEEAAQRGAIDRSFHGINLVCWIRAVSAARAHAEVAERERPTNNPATIAAELRTTPGEIDMAGPEPEAPTRQ